MSMGFGFSLPAYPLRGGGGNNPFNQTGPTLDLSFVDGATNVGNQLGADTYTLDTNFITPQYQVAAQYAVWVAGSGLTQRNFADIVTFSRTSGATWFNSAGVNVGIDFSTSSVTIGTGSKTFTLTATAGIDRSWAAGDIVRISEQATPANFMDGTVTSYTASTQTLVVNVTATGGSGTIASWRVSSHMPRFDYNPATLAAQGLLIEEQRTNLLLQSADFTTTWTQTNVTITANTTASPDGGTNGDTLLINAAGATTSQTSQSFTAGSTITVSVFAKKNASNFVRFEVGGLVSCWFDLNTGVPGTNNAGSGNVLFSAKSIQAISNGWYRCVLTVTTSTITTLGVNIFATNADGVSSSINSSVFLWGAQLEAGAFPTSYIPTTVAQVTRSADVASVNTLAPWFNSTAGTLYAEYNIPFALTAGTNPRSFTLQGAGGASVDDFPLFINQTSGKAASFNAFTGGVNAGRIDASPAFAANTVIKAAATYAANDRAVTTGGAVPTTSATVYTIPTITVARLGAQDIAGVNAINGYLRRIVYYPRRLPNADLQTITA